MVVSQNEIGPPHDKKWVSFERESLNMDMNFPGSNFVGNYPHRRIADSEKRPQNLDPIYAFRQVNLVTCLLSTINVNSHKKISQQN